ncbi:MAG: Na+/H+ antiporter subunit E [Myxococcales bacterium]|nr:Na+/H+ antiporter subunit E [Myxococcales bacterium]
MFRLLVLGVAWLLWSGHYTLEEPLIAAFGVLSCGLVYWIAQRLRAAAPEHGERTLGWSVVPYLPWLLLEIVKADLAVAKIVLDPKMPISPRIIRVKASQRGDGARVLFANSITLTPGTISLAVREDHIWVHALSKEIGDDLQSGEMDQKVAGLERT